MAIGMALALTALFIAGGEAADPYCTPKTGTPKKAMPKLDFKAFTSEYRAVIENKKSVLWSKEFYDSVNNKAKIEIVNNGIESTLLIDYYYNTYILLEYEEKNKLAYNCTISQLDTVHSDNLDIFGFKLQPSDTSKNIPHILKSADILQSVKDYEYMGETHIDGLPVDHFQSCMTWDDVSATFTLDYYFTTTEFKPRDKLTPSQVPVRADVKGAVDKGGQTNIFHHTYEYLDFRVFSELPPEAFSLPEYLRCSGAKTAWQKPFPVLPKSMSYTVEKVTHSQSGDVQIELATVHIDGFWKLIRVDQRGSTSISDFSTGVEYVIDDNGCATRAIRPDNVAWAQEVGGVIKMKDRPEVSYLKKNFVFSGVKKFRGISTYSFAADLADGAVEAYINIYTPTPVGLNVSKATQTTVFNIFNFDATSNRSNERPFDIQRCGNSAKVSDYTMTLHRDTKRFDSIRRQRPFSPDLNSWGNSFRAKAAELAEVSPMQIVSKDVSLDDYKGTVYWKFRILDQDQKTDQALVEDQLQLKEHSDIALLLRGALDRGKFTLVIKRPRYTDFKGLDMSLWSDSLNVNVKSDIMYSFQQIFGKCVLEFEDDSEFYVKQTVHECAQACADTRPETCTLFEHVAVTKACQLSWSDASPILIDARSDACSVYRNSYLGYFSAYRGYTLVKYTDVAYQSADDEETCAKLCFNEKSFHCESFDYCAAKKRCQMYKTHFYDDAVIPDKVDTETQDCVHYSRRYPDFQNYYGGDFESPNPLQVMTDSYNECAYLCSKDEDGCLAFSYCSPDVVTGQAQGSCKLLPATQASQVTFKSTSGQCHLGISPFVRAIGPGEKQPVTVSDLMSKSKDGGSRYGSGAMLGVAVAMVTAGIGLAALVVFLLQRFNVWGGF